MPDDTFAENIARCHEEMKSLLPTPPIGTTVIWYGRGLVEDENQQAAVVTKIEGIATLTLTIFPPNGIPIHKKGVRFVTHPQHLQKNNPSTVQNGAWDYPDHRDVPKRDLEKHRVQLTTKISQIQSDREAFEEAARAREERLAAKAAPAQTTAS